MWRSPLAATGSDLLSSMAKISRSGDLCVLQMRLLPVQCLVMNRPCMRCLRRFPRRPVSLSLRRLMLQVRLLYINGNHYDLLV